LKGDENVRGGRREYKRKSGEMRTGDERTRREQTVDGSPESERENDNKARGGSRCRAREMRAFWERRKTRE